MGNLGWKTIVGTVLLAVGGALGGLEGCIGACQTAASVLVFIGTLLTGVGIRHAITKIGSKSGG